MVPWTHQGGSRDGQRDLAALALVRGLVAAAAATAEAATLRKGSEADIMNWKHAIPTSVLSAGLIGVTAAMSTSVASPDRIGGSDRYESSVLISQEAFPDGADTVFLGSGEDFPDALAGGAAGGTLSAPVLLVTATSIPDVVTAELARLDPSLIVILGGETAVSAEVAEEALEYGKAVERLGGENRYETAALIAEWAFEPGVPVAYLASGSDYPDALAGAAAAGFTNGPVLLTKTEALSDEAAEQLEALLPEQIIVLGGTAAVAEAVATEALDYGNVSRLAGDDRYATSAAISAGTFSSAEVVYIATGTSYPDALSGAPLAAANSAPILLVTRDSVSAEVCAEVNRLEPGAVVALGGPSAVSDTVLHHVAAGCPAIVVPIPPKPGPTYTIDPPPDPMAEEG